MFDVISIGNISIDTFYQGESLTLEGGRFQLALGGKYFTDFAVQTLGGGGANVAIGAARHGLKSGVVGTIGKNSFKKMILSALEDHNVSTELCVYEENYLNVSSILITFKGEKTVIHYSTPHRGILREAEQHEKIFRTKMVYLGNLPDVSVYERTRFVEKLKRHNIKMAINLGAHDCRLPKSALKPLLENLDFLILNGHEFADLVKAPYRDIHFRENVIQWYIPLLRDKHVVVTEGRSGSYLYYDGTVYHQAAEKVIRIIDTTGAGDGFTSGFVASYLKGDNMEKAMQSGAEYAVKILSKIGAN